MANIGFLQDDNARVIAQFPIELAIAHVDGENARRAMGEQTVGETAGRCADIEGRFTCDRDRELLQRFLKLETAAADVSPPGTARLLSSLGPR